MVHESFFLKQKGFTLFEILLVIALIVILTVGGLAAYGVSQRNGRDAKRRTDLEVVRQALELYKSDHGHYPGVTGAWSGVSPSSLSTFLGPYLSNVPQDPITNRTYRWVGINCFFIGTEYVCPQFQLCAALENSNPGSCANPGTDYCAGTITQCNYGVSNP